jgi:hypothetical protein
MHAPTHFALYFPVSTALWLQDRLKAVCTSPLLCISYSCYFFQCPQVHGLICSNVPCFAHSLSWFHTHLCLHTQSHVSTHSCLHTPTHVSTHTHVCTSILMFPHTHVCTSILMFTYTLMFAHPGWSSKPTLVLARQSHVSTPTLMYAHPVSCLRSLYSPSMTYDQSITTVLIGYEEFHTILMFAHPVACLRRSIIYSAILYL